MQCKGGSRESDEIELIFKPRLNLFQTRSARFFSLPSIDVDVCHNCSLILIFLVLAMNKYAEYAYKSELLNTRKKSEFMKYS